MENWGYGRVRMVREPTQRLTKKVKRLQKEFALAA